MSARRLIVNADDFGLSAGVNRGIALAHQGGIVTSASLMVWGAAAQGAAGLAREWPDLSVGLHLDLAEWSYDRATWTWVPNYMRTDLDDLTAVAAEVDRQIERCVDLLGVLPTHVDSHQHVHRAGIVADVVRERAAQHGLPLREWTPTVAYVGAFYGQSGKGDPVPDAIEVPSLRRVLRTLPEGTTELGCHPGFGDDLLSDYRTERRQETESLCDPRIRDLLTEYDVELINFRQLAA